MDTPDTSSSARWLNSGVWLIATCAIGLVLWSGARILAPFAMAVFIWLIMEGFARAIRRPFPHLPGWVASLLAVTLVALGVLTFVSIVSGAIAEFQSKSAGYEAQINTVIRDIYDMLPGLQAAGSSPAPATVATAAAGSTPTLSDLATTYAGAIAPTAAAFISGLIGDMLLILVYVAFLSVSAGSFSGKLDRIFRHPAARERSRRLGEQVRRTMEQYLWVQTSLSILSTGLSYLTMQALGLDNALFWSFVIFVLNYIPTIGAMIATTLPALFAILQPEASWPSWMPDSALLCAATVFAGLSVWQFLIGNFLAPRLQAGSLNLSPLVVLLSLAVWGGLWGPVGMFLSGPLSVLVMIVLAQTPGARWIAILMSADGAPGEAPQPAGGSPVSAGEDHRFGGPVDL
jgi:AI-2 transport protein TqsA